MNDFFHEVIKKHSDQNHVFKSFKNVSGGCINSAAKITTNDSSFFIKWNSATELDLFRKESLGLEVLRSKSAIKIPQCLGYGEMMGKAYLLLEWIESGDTTSSFWKIFGEQLALQHQVTDKQFGLDHDNFIGRLPQSNRKHVKWDTFFVEERILPQIKLAQQQKLIDQKLIASFEILFKELDSLIPEETPSLLHGDLWSGNFLGTKNSTPAIFDPAVHYGHRETELAFTKLFGGFDRSFYDHYEEVYPLQPGFQERVAIHNLYPLLVHVNLFGTSYLSGIMQTLKRFT